MLPLTYQLRRKVRVKKKQLHNKYLLTIKATRQNCLVAFLYVKKFVILLKYEKRFSECAFVVFGVIAI